MDHELLKSVRLGILVSQKRNSEAIAVPIWFDWNGEKIAFFAGSDSKKVKRLENNPRVSLLVTNNVGEPEAWLAFDGDAQLCEGSGIDLAETLALRYWDMDTKANQEKLDAWKLYPDAFVRYEFTPANIRQGS
jgi:PPOX class probable F420-dependent enzyme